MSQPIIYVDVSEIREGKLAELEPAMTGLAGFVEENMPRLISYGFYLDQERSQMTVVAVHPDSASLEFHMDRGRDEFRKFADLIELSKIEIYGSVSDEVLERLHEKARALGRGTVEVYALHAGFSRWSKSRPA